MFNLNADKYPEKDDIDEQLNKILERDWDCLAILDACRYDVLDGISEETVEPVKVPNKRGTPGWLDAVWNTEGWQDVTYVSGHPMTKGIKIMDDLPDFDMDAKLKDHIPAWEQCESHHNVVQPEVVYRAARNINPPVVAHFVQPHEPFIGDVNIEIRNRDWLPEDNDYPDPSPIYNLIDTGDLSPRIVRAAYNENAKLGYEWARKLESFFDNLVITADHGESLGENDDWSHGGESKVGMIVGWLEFS